jgi:hypothetical protein
LYKILVSDILTQMNRVALSDSIDRFLCTGDFDPLFREWPGKNILDCISRGSNDLRDALIEEVRHRERNADLPRPASPQGDDLAAFTRAKVEPMVHGLFGRNESEPVIALLEKSVVFLTPEHIEPQIRDADLDTAWKIANIYLASVGAERLGQNSRYIVGLSVDTTCYISVEYFSDEDPFSDFVIHETAHVFHNCKRRTAGFQETRRCEWLLPIGFKRRETFAYACEAYGRILERAKKSGDRAVLFEQLKRLAPPPDARVDPMEYLDILAEALGRRNGWKAILERCSADS